MANGKDTLASYNQAQREAILHDTGPALVLAGAGTGKTAVITARIVRLILEKNVSPERILALTFTEKAAREMQQRVDELLPYGMVETQIMTFHGLAERLLREYALDIGLASDYQIASLAQSTIVMQEVLSSLKFKYYSPAHQPFDFVQALLSAVSRLKDEGMDVLELRKRLKTKEIASDAELKQRYEELAQCYEAYQKACAARNLLDFGDLLMFLTQLLQRRPKVRAEISERFEYVLIDEFQDTNTIQMAILQLILPPKKSVMVVGDDDQAIYKFRGASVENILSFQKTFPDSKLIVLTENYRSGQQILDTSYDLIQHNNPHRLEDIQKIDKHLHAQDEQTGAVNYRLYADKLDEQAGLVENIEKLLGEGVESKSIAILLRKNNQIKPYMQLLTQHKILFYVHQSLDLFGQAPIKMLLALCAALANPHDDQALYHVLSSDLFKVPIGELIHISAKARSAHVNLGEYCQSEGLEIPEIDKAMQLLQQWRELAKEQQAGELLYIILKQSGYLPQLLKIATEDSEAAVRVQLIAEFFQIVKEFELSSEYTDIVNFATFMGQLQRSSADIFAEISPLDVEGVQILTVHRAKGLEFEHVFLPELTEQTFPTYAHAEKIKLDQLFATAPTDHYAEERRLFYVAMTRAKQGLYLSSAHDHGGKRPKRPSRFIVEALGKEVITAPKSEPKQTDLTEFLQSFEPVQLPKDESRLSAHLYVDGWLRLSTNQVADYLRSPREFWLFQVLKMPKGPFHSLIYGSAIHAALEYYYQQRAANKSVEVTDMQAVFKEAWQQEGFVSAEHAEALYKKGLVTLSNYVTNHAKIDDKPVAIEKPFELHLPELKTIISGRYDLVLQAGEGVEIRDFKTSEVDTEKKADRRAKDSIQLGIYALSWEKLQQQSVKCTSLEFVNNNVVGKNAKIDHEKTMNKIAEAAQGIKNMQFGSTGDSQLNFERLLP